MKTQMSHLRLLFYTILIKLCMGYVSYKRIKFFADVQG